MRLVNRQPYPIGLASQNGVCVQFEVGAWTDDPFYEKYVGPGGLSKEGDEVSQAPHPDKASAGMTAKQAPQVQMLENLGLREDGENRFCSLKDGLLTCKLCQTFRTGSQSTMDIHLSRVHKINLQEELPLKNAIQRSREVEEAKRSGKKEDKVEDKPDDGFFHCPHCDKPFKTESGMKKHMKKAHGRED